MTPPDSIAATERSEDHVTFEVRSCCEPSENVPVIVACAEDPSDTVSGAVILIELSCGVGVVVGVVLPACGALVDGAAGC
jgi:hypothetical protein